METGGISLGVDVSEKAAPTPLVVVLPTVVAGKARLGGSSSGFSERPGRERRSGSRVS